MDALCRSLWTLFCQIAATLGCLVMLILMLSVLSAMFGYPDSYPDRLELFANFTTAPLVLYISFRIGFYYGHTAHPLPSSWFIRMFGLAGCLAMFWGMVRLGMLDMFAHLFSPMSSDYVAGDLPPWNLLQTSLLLVKLTIALTAIVYLGKKCLSEVRNSNLPIKNPSDNDSL